MTRTNGSTATRPREVSHRLVLFVAGDRPNSRLARKNLAELCERELHGRCEVEIVDVVEDFAAAAEHDILVTPTLLVLKPEPAVTVIGNLSDRKRVRAALHLEGA